MKMEWNMCQERMEIIPETGEEIDYFYCIKLSDVHISGRGHIPILIVGHEKDNSPNKVY